MRHLITNYTFEADGRTIVLPDFPDITLQNIRLIVNETQKKVLCSSMQKDNIVSVASGEITYADTLPALSDGDYLTIEVDMGNDAEIIDSIIYYKTHRTETFDRINDILGSLEIPSLVGGGSLFGGLTLPKRVVVPNLRNIGVDNFERYLFASSSGIEELSFPNLETIAGANAFSGFLQDVSTIRKLDLPNLVSCANYGLSGAIPSEIVQFEINCPKLIVLPNAAHFGTFWCGSTEWYIDN